MNQNRGTGKKTEGDEVEELLRVAQDEMLLGLSVDAHMSRVSPSYLQPDLDRRFQALKSSSSSSSRAVSRPQGPQPPQRPTIREIEKPREEKDAIQQPQQDENDLFARFAALKASLPSSTPCSSSLTHESHLRPYRSDYLHQFDQPPRADGGDVDEDEVAKLIQWAMDAARLDPSPPTDSDDDVDDHDDGDCDDESRDEQVESAKTKNRN